MGEVYRAIDPRLKRSVAIKILPPEVSRDPERLGRFQREAQVLASLNHPNIAAIYGVEEWDGVPALVMELVEGQTLAERLLKGPLPGEEIVAIAKELVEALGAAHEKGIVHRDLKPANIKIKPEGEVKVLDFGLAKAVVNVAPDSDPNSSPTLTAMTQGPAILGTAAYMSPEQARGRSVDQRTDVWSFGCVLFEMLAGRRPFAGDTATDILAGIIRSEPDWSLLPKNTAQPLRRLLRQCLEKDPRQRLQNIRDGRFELQESQQSEVTVAPGPSTRHRFLWTGWAVAIVLAPAVLLLGFALHRAARPPLRKFEVIVAGLNPGLVRVPEISPDGRRIAYYAGGHLWVRELDQLIPGQVSAADDSDAYFWSPDSAYLAFGEKKKLWKIPAHGGTREVICDVPDTGVVLSGAWSTNGSIALSVWRSSVYQVPATGGVAKLLLPVSSDEVDFHNLSYLPDGKTLLFMVHPKNDDVTISTLSGGSRKALLKQPKNGVLGDPAYSTSGHLLYIGGNGTDYSIMAVPFSVSSQEVIGEPFVVAANAAYPSVADDGTLVYVPNRPKLRQLVWLSPAGKIETAIGAGQDLLEAPALSPDGRQAAVSTEDNNAVEIWMYNLADGNHHRLTFSDQGATAISPVFSPARGQLAFGETHDINSSIRMVSADGSGNRQIVAKGMPGSFTPDGKILAFTSQDVRGKYHLLYASTDGSGEPVILSHSDANEADPEISPNGRFFAYTSDESGREEVYVRPFPAGDAKWQVSTTGGSMARWSPAGNKLIFVHENDLITVDVSSSPSFGFSAPSRLLSGESVDFGNGYAVARDGRILAVQELDQGKSGGPMVVVQNWYAQFRKK